MSKGTVGKEQEVTTVQGSVTSWREYGKEQYFLSFTIYLHRGFKLPVILPSKICKNQVKLYPLTHHLLRTPMVLLRGAHTPVLLVVSWDSRNLQPYTTHKIPQCACLTEQSVVIARSSSECLTVAHCRFFFKIIARRYFN